VVEIPPKPRRGDPILAEWGAGVIDCLTSRNWEKIAEVERTDWESNPVEVQANRNVYDMFLVFFEGEVLPPSGADAQLLFCPEGSETATATYRGFYYTSTTIGVLAGSLPVIAIGGSSLQQESLNLSTLLVYPSGQSKLEVYSFALTAAQVFGYYLWVDYTYPSPFPSRAFLRMSVEGGAWKGKILIYGRRV